MPSPETGFLFEESFTEEDWDEVMNPDARSDTLSPDRSSCVVPIKVSYAKYKSAVKWCLGYGWVDQSNKLRRATPAFHPTYPWLFCAREGDFRPVDPLLTHLSLVGSLVFFFATRRFRERVFAKRRPELAPPDPDAFVKYTQELLTHGLAAPRADGGQRP